MIGTVATAATITDMSNNRCNFAMENCRFSGFVIFATATGPSTSPLVKEAHYRLQSLSSEATHDFSSA